MSRTINWETDAGFAQYPIGTEFKLKLTRRCGFLWLNRKTIVTEAKVVAQDTEVVKRDCGEDVELYFHSVLELQYHFDHVLNCRRFLLAKLMELAKNGTIELLHVPDQETQIQDNSRTFCELKIGDTVRAYHDFHYIEGNIVKVAGVNVYDIADHINPMVVHQNVSLRELIWYKRNKPVPSVTPVLL